MADRYPVPTLSTDGWVYNTEKKADYLLAHFLVSEHSQDPFFDRIASFTWLLANHGEDMVTLASQTEQTLIDYLKAYFPRVDCQVRTEQIDGNPNTWRIRMGVTITDLEGREFTLNNVARVENGKTVEFARLNNGSLPITVGY